MPIDPTTEPIKISEFSFCTIPVMSFFRPPVVVVESLKNNYILKESF